MERSTHCVKRSERPPLTNCWNASDQRKTWVAAGLVMVYFFSAFFRRRESIADLFTK